MKKTQEINLSKSIWKLVAVKIIHVEVYQDVIHKTIKTKVIEK